VSGYLSGGERLADWAQRQAAVAPRMSEEPVERDHDDNE